MALRSSVNSQTLTRSTSSRSAARSMTRLMASSKFQKSERSSSR